MSKYSYTSFKNINQTMLNQKKNLKHELVEIKNTFPTI